MFIHLPVLIGLEIEVVVAASQELHFGNGDFVTAIADARCPGQRQRIRLCLSARLAISRGSGNRGRRIGAEIAFVGDKVIKYHHPDFEPVARLEIMYRAFATEKYLAGAKIVDQEVLFALSVYQDAVVHKQVGGGFVGGAGFRGDPFFAGRKTEERERQSEEDKMLFHVKERLKGDDSEDGCYQP